MKGANLGELEELVLLTIASLVNEAYSVAICDELESRTGRSARLGMVHAVLNRLEEKGLVKSKLGEATSERGGKRKRYYALTSAGKSSLIKAKEIRDQLWASIPPLVLRKICASKNQNHQDLQNGSSTGTADPMCLRTCRVT